jgi:serine/threonine-protein kinase
MTTEAFDASGREQRFQEVLAAYLQAVEAGQQPDRDEWLKRHPDVAAELRSFFANRDEFTRLAERLSSAPTRAAASEHPTLPYVGESGLPVKSVERCYFGEYELLEKIAGGSMGVVYKARQAGVQRVVALKMIRAGQLASDTDVRRFLAEAEAAANLDHANIVPLYEVGEHAGQHYFSMKYIEGGSLRARVKEFTRDPKATAKLMATIAHAVHYAHQRGILHRDLKPTNILLDARGQPHVIDFGLAKKVGSDSGMTVPGAIVGTPSYMAPEQARGEKGLTIAVDVYGLGAILYEILTGAPPFRGASVTDTVHRILTQPVIRPVLCAPGVPPDLEAICLRCLEKAPADRYPTAEAVAEDLDRFLRGEPRKDSQPGVASRVARAVRQRTEVPSMITLPAICWAIPIVLLQHVGIFVLARTDQPVYWAWMCVAFAAGLRATMLWRYHLRQHSSVTAGEKQSLAISVANLLVNLALLGASGPLSPLASTRELLPDYYPPLMIATGIWIYMHGITHWGIFFVQGIVFLPLALLLRLVPDWSPLLYASFVASQLIWSAVMARRLIQDRSNGKGTS